MELERGSIDLNSGEFPLTLFTNGEASDGHIIDIDGLRIPDQLPMYVNHIADPRERAGSLLAPVKEVPIDSMRTLGDSRVRMVGRIDVTGDSAAADIRRDLAHGVSVGDINAMSGRWDGLASEERSGLPSDHIAYKERSHGLYFSEAVALEGSIVGLGADKDALIGRSKDLSKAQHVRDFYTSLVEGFKDEAGEAVDVAGILAAYAAQGRQIPGLKEIATNLGRFCVPEEVADAWERSSIEEQEVYIESPDVDALDRSLVEQPIAKKESLDNQIQTIIKRARENSHKKLNEGVSAILAEHFGRDPNG